MPPSTTPGAGVIAACWSRSTTSDYYWRPAQGPVGFTNTGPNADHTTGSGKYLFTEGVFTSGSSLVMTSLVTPWVDLSGATAPELRFWDYRHGFNLANLTVEVQTSGSSAWTNIVTLIGTSQTTANDPWNEHVHSLSSFLGDTVRVRFSATRSSSFSTTAQFALDDIRIAEAPTCPRPTGVFVSSRTQTSIEIGWVSPGTNDAQIRYVSTNQPLSAATIVNANSTNPFNITGLAPSTSYRFWVRDSCGVGDVGLWYGPFTETTVCGVITAPWNETFDGSQWESGTAFNDPGNIAACWNRNPSASNYMWVPGPLPFPTTFTGPSIGHNNSSGWLQADDVAFGTFVGSLIRTPQIDLTGLTAPELRFWYHMYGTTIDKLEVDVKSNSGSWTTMLTITGAQQAAQSDPWQENFVSLSSFAGDTVFVRFRAYYTTSGFGAGISIDDLSIDEEPPCPRPNPISLVSTTDQSATLTWTSGGTAPWQIEYGTPGFSPGSGTLVNATSNPFTITGLTPQTAYDFYVRDTCGVNGVSVWTGPISGMTQCSPIAAPFTENFDGASFIGSTTFNTQGTFDPCWIATDADYYWTPSPPTFNSFTSGPSADHTTGTGDYIYADGAFNSGADTAVLYSPIIDVSSLNTPELTFWYHMYGNGIGSVHVDVSTGTSWTREWSVTGQQHNAKSDSWSEATIDLSAYSGGNLQVRFVTRRNTTLTNNLRAAIDDFDIHEQPACPKVLNFVSSGKTTTSISLQWATGTGTSWDIEYGPSGFPVGTGTVQNATSSPATINGLQPSTAYDFYITRDCGVDGLSETVGPITVTTGCGPVPAPFREDFEGNAWQIAAGFGSVGTIAPCWVRSDTVAYVWTAERINTFPQTTGPSAGASGSGKYMYTDVKAFGTSVNSALRTPQIDLTPLDTPQLRFWYHMYGANISEMSVQVKSGTGPWTNVWSKTGEQQTSPTAPWLEAVVDLSNYTNQTVFIRWVATRTPNGFTCEIALDDISIDEKPNCPGPTDLTAVGVSETAVQVDWTSTSSGPWQIEYGPAGFIPGTGTYITANNVPFIVNGLLSNTPYDFYVRDSCSTGGYSWAAGPVSASTYPCPGACLYELILSDSGSNGWQSGGLGDFHQAVITVDGVATQFTLYSGASQSFLVPICDSSVYSLSFINNGFQSNQCGIVWKDPSGTTLFTQSPSFTNLPTGQLYSDTGSCSSVCPEPVGLTALNPSTTGVDVFWSSLSGSSQIAYGTTGFALAGPSLTSVTSPSSLSGLSPNTTYDIYVRDSCDDGTFSNWVGPVTFSTVGCGPVGAQFTASSSGLQVSLDGTSSTGSIQSHSWDFGDGSTGSGASAGHTYGVAGVYTITLVVTNPCGLTDTTTQVVYVCGVPTAAASANTSGLSITGDASTSAGLNLQYFWDYGDGNTGNGVSPNHTYAAAGTYNVLMWVTDTCGSTDTTSLSVTVCSAPVPSFTFTVTGMTAQFDASSSVGATSYYWTFGNGNNATGVTASETYGSNATYTVTLYAINACGDTVSTSQLVNLCPAPVADWFYQVIQSTGAGMLVQFNATASVATSYYWDFGDGSTATGTNFPTHLYITPGFFYYVTLIVENACGESDTMAYRLSASVGLEEVEVDPVLLFPNPSTGTFELDYPKEWPSSIALELYTTDGRAVWTGQTYQRHQVMNLPSDLTAGTYILRVYHGQSSQTLRLNYTR